MNKLDLKLHEGKKYSQNGEDGVLVALLNTIKNLDKDYCEIGVEVGVECNTRILWNDFGFNGVMFDGKYENKQINLFQQFFTKENVLDVFKKFNISKNVDVFSLDIDLNDFYVMKEILKEYSPKIIICEYNSYFNYHEDKITIYSPNEYWDGSNYQHASLLSWHKLFSKYNYSLVYCEKNGINCFWLRNDLIPENIEIENINNLQALYKKRDWDTPDKRNRDYITFDEAFLI
jgi:hypothetical protein